MPEVPTEAEQIREAASLRPEPMPERRLVEDAIEPRVFLEQRRSDPKFSATAPSSIATGKLLAWRADVLQRNRGALAALLWACVRFKHAVVSDGSLVPVAEQLAAALRIWGWPKNAYVPDEWVERRRFVEAWGTKQWGELHGQKEAA